jgi:cyclophilin family peptidyl-prolyl cis-trans isomerase
MKTLLMLAAAAAATPAPKAALAPSEIVAAAPKGDWVAIAASDLLVMDLASGKRVVIQLMPPPFSQGWVGNIRKLAAAKWWDGTSINRVQDNYVVQWGDATEKKALPADLLTVLQNQYVFPADQRIMRILSDKQRIVTRVVATRPARINETRPIRMSDPYSAVGGHLIGWPIATGDGGIWPVHCYGMVGVGRDMPPDTGTGAELYTVIGHAPRHLDRNIALVGRVISGIENLSSLPRGTGPLGFYEKPEQRVTIMSIRIGSEIKDLPRFEYLSTESASFAAYADARANRRDPFFIVPAGGADICNIPVPVRVAK